MPPPLDLLPALLGGSLVTIKITVLASSVAVLAAVLAGLGRGAPFAPIRWMTAAYVETFRGTSALVQLFWLYFALPFFGVDLGAMLAGVLALGLNTGAYGAEVVRGSLRAVPHGQTEASIALNMTPWQRMRYVIFPQALVAMLPPWGNLLIELLKNSALVSLITITELTYAGQIQRMSSLRTTEIFALILVLYFLLALVITATMRLLERGLGRGMQRGGIR